MAIGDRGVVNTGWIWTGEVFADEFHWVSFICVEFDSVSNGNGSFESARCDLSFVQLLHLVTSGCAFILAQAINFFMSFLSALRHVAPTISPSNDVTSI